MKPSGQLTSGHSLAVGTCYHRSTAFLPSSIEDGRTVAVRTSSTITKQNNQRLITLEIRNNCCVRDEVREGICYVRHVPTLLSNYSPEKLVRGRIKYVK